MAVPTSFKQQCPSCEAMVPIRDPKLIGRKIDCPKCKYRFIVEEPADDVEEAEEAAPIKKGKAGAASMTAKKPAAKAPAKRRADDDQDMDEAPPKKKQGGSGMLIVGIGLAAVAVLALGVGGFFLLSDSGSDDTKTTRRPPPASNASTENEKKTEEPKAAPTPSGPRPRQEDITNLLPNDTQYVLNLPLEHLLGNAKVNQALLQTPGAFHEGSFQNIWGVAPSAIRRVLVAANVEKKTLFCVMRTSEPMKEKQFVEVLNLKPESAINGLRYYLLKKPLDALSTVLLKGAMYRDKLALHLMDPFTVVCADPEPMKQFLQDKGQPKQLSSKKTDEEDQPSGGGGPAGMQGGFPGMPGGGPRPMPGPSGPSGGPRPMPGPPGMIGGGPSRRPGGGGFQPPPGMPPGMGGARNTEGNGDKNGPAPISSSYMTVDPNLKAVLDQVEKVDKTENQNVLLSSALSSSAVTVEHVQKFLAWARTQEGGAEVPQVPDLILKANLESIKSYAKAVGVAITDFSESKVAGNVAVAAADAGVAQFWEKKINETVPNLLPSSLVDFISPNAGAGNMPNMPGMPNMPNMPGMPGGPSRPNMPNMPGMPNGPNRPNMPSPPRPPGGGMPNGPSRPNMPSPPQPPGGGMPNGPSRPNMPSPPRPPGGGMPMPPGGPGMMPPGQGDDPNEQATKLGTLVLWTKAQVLALGITYNIPSEQYKAVGDALELGSIYFRGIAAMSDRQSHIHELAAATQAYLAEKGSFPRGALTRPLDSQRVLDWRPDQRLSWMTQLLPYIAGGEFKDLKLEDNKSWYEGSNIKAALTLIPQFVTHGKLNDLGFFVPYPNLPNKGIDRWAATHFVGIAGLGLDAAEYRADDPATAKKLGVFGYDRETKKAQIKDGVDQTIVLIQTPSSPKSPWLAGGGSTVRGISEDLECVQPFVCTEYKGKRGTFAIMADGKVRFIAENINPKTFQAMCTIAGGDKIGNIEKEAPEVPPEETKQVELKTEQAAPAAPSPAAKPPAAKPPAAKPAQDAAKSKLPPGWKEIVSKEGRYSVAVPPGQMQEISRKDKFSFGEGTLYQKIVTMPRNVGVYMVQYMDVSGNVKDVETVFDGFRNDLVSTNPGSQVRDEKKITLAGRPGREFRILVPQKGDVSIRVFLDKNRLYSLVSRGSRGRDATKDDQTFFDSFKLIEK